MPISPAEQRAIRNLADLLKSLREDTGFDQPTVAEALGVNRHRVSYLERGRGWPKPGELARLFDLYQVQKPVRTIIQRMIEEGKTVGGTWWDDYLPHMTRDLAELVDIESVATAISMASSSALPGLLQVREHIEALFAFDKTEKGSARTQALMDVRQRRQQEVFERATPVRFQAVFTEGVLRTEVGGSEAMRKQLGHLLSLAERPDIKLQILHYASGAAAALCGTFSILDFDGARPTVVHSDVGDGVKFEEKKGEVQQVIKRYEVLAGAALTPEQSIELIEKIRKGM